MIKGIFWQINENAKSKFINQAHKASECMRFSSFSPSPFVKILSLGKEDPLKKEIATHSTESGTTEAT